MSRSRSKSPEAGQHGGNNGGNNGGNRPNGQQNIKCNSCGKMGHKAVDCRNKQSNQNNTRPQNQLNQSKGGKSLPEPEGGPSDGCYLHKGKGHTNEQCFSHLNPMSPNFKGDKKSAQKQKPIKVNVPYCDRCNKLDHDVVDCCNLPVSDQCVISCKLCGSRGHQHSQCNNPSFCRNCGTTGHSAAGCKQAKSDVMKLTEHTVEILPTPQDVSWHNIIGSSHVTPDQVQYMHQTGAPLKNQHQMYYEKAEVARCGWSPYRCYYGIGIEGGPSNNGFANWNAVNVSHGNVNNAFARCATAYPNKAGSTQAWAAPGLVNKVGGVEDKEVQHLRELRNAEDAKRRREIADKIFASRQMYPWRNINDDILVGETVIANIVKALQEGRKKDADYHPEALQIIKHWYDNRTFHTAAALVANKGWTFIRDPATMDAIARAHKPVCNDCEETGYFYDVLFQRIPYGADVRELTDGADMGVMVAFPCQCCAVKGHSFVNAADVMEVDA